MSGLAGPALFILAAAGGSALRYAANVHVRLWKATLLVNVVGSFLLGWIVAGGFDDTTVIVAGTGFCGALTTYSTFTWEIATSLGHRRAQIVLYNVTLGLAAAALGWYLA